MLDFKEYTGKNIDDALTNACVDLGTTTDKLEYEVISKGSNGILGIGSKPAVIKARKNQSIEDIAREFLGKVFEAMELTVKINMDINEEDGVVNIDLVGDDMGILIGKRGQTLDSLQYLVSLVINKESEKYLRVKLDTENYRERRKATLENLAKNIAFKVKRIKKPVSLEPMNPYERRIIHATVSTVEGATSSSIGEEPNRRVVISSTNPVKKYNNYKGKKKPYNKGGYRPNGRRPQGEGRGNAEGQEKKPYVFRNKEDGENRRRAPRQNNEFRERKFEERNESNAAPRTDVPRSTPPREAEDKPLYAKIDLE